MNISQPIASQIESVSFAPLTSEDIQKLSVKRITTSTTFDSLLHPVPGGLYDPALGAFLDNACTTCHLDIHSCPGHCGHIELPVNVYHCLYMDQAYRLLRAQCQYCHRLRMSRIEVNLYWCKLRLVKYGLLKEAREVEDVGLKGKKNKLGADEGEGEDLSEDDDTNNIIEQRRYFVTRSLKHVESRKRKAEAPAVETEAGNEARKMILKDFHAAVVRSRKCANCKGISALYRKNQYTSIFRKPLSMKDRSANVQNGIRSSENPLILLNKFKREQERKLRKHAQNQAAQNGALHVDEGVADMDDSMNEDVDEPQILDGGEEVSEEESEEEAQAGAEGSMFQTESNLTRAKRNMKNPEEAQVYVNANEIHASLVQLFEKEKDIMSMVYSGSKTADGSPSADMFFIQHLVVPPNRFRKESKTGGADEISEAADNTSYRNILSACEEIFQIRRELHGERDENIRRIRDFSDLQNAWLKLQDSVNSLIDKEKNTTKGLAALRIPQGIKQKLEKKEGLFRMNMMGKRVNFAARSVISPDPNIETNEIGVPPVFAKKLTYPEPVTTHNFQELKVAVINGSDKWPGAAAVEYENGQIINLRHKNQEERTAIANLLMAPSSTSMTGVRNKKVHRHLNNGDVVIMNRQPTLHKASMMVHRARVLPGEKTIRMHYANCNSYNADFDGDEMNMHFPQNEVARAEALMVADTDHQYISATAGQPLRGLIQDHLTMGVWLTCLDSFFTREEYQELLYSGIRPEHNHTDSDRIKTMEPALIKPVPRWTGKQVISTILLNIKPHTHAHLNLHSKSQVPGTAWGPDSEEQKVVFKDGELCTGILDKKQIGQSAGGFIHAVYEAYGHTIAGRVLSILGRLLTRLLSMRAFSCGVEDLILTDIGEQARQEALLPAKDIGLEVAAKYVSLQDSKPRSTDKELLNRLESVFRDEGKQEGLDRVTNSRTGELSSLVTKACLPNNLIKLFPHNQMQTMTTSGAKGSIVNANLISCNLGQQVLEGRRVPIMISGKSLPSFKPYEQHIRAGGYIVDRFLTGVRPQEYFFHTMAGREGLIDTAVKTSRSGYLQRCLIKGMEGLRAEYDSSVRDADGSIIQTIYGEDGLDVTKSSMLTNFKFVAQNFLSLFASLNVRDELDRTSSAEAQEWNKTAIKKVRKSGDIAIMDPALSMFPPASNAGSTSEQYYMESKDYMDSNPDRLIKSKKQGVLDGTPKGIFENLLHINYLKAIVAPGEAIGVVAAQSIGEPSTQMTLNTFHLAGHSSKNVTLGIPRLREILMTASMTIKTPSMLMYPIPELPKDQIEKFAKGISRISLAEAIDEIDVEERLGSGIYQEARIYKVRMKFYPAEEYLETYGVSKQDVVRTIENKFLPRLQARIRTELKKRKEEKTLKLAAKSDARPEIGESVGRVLDEQAHSSADHEGGDSDVEDGGDDDATNAKNKTNRDEGVSYEDPDEEDEAVLRQAEKDEEGGSDDEDEGYGGSPHESEESDSESGRKPANKKVSAKDRESRIMNKFQDVTSFSFDDKNGSSCEVIFQYAASTAKLLLLSLVNASAHDALIQSVTSISSCSVGVEDVVDADTKKKVKVTVLNTDGANLLAMRDYQGVINPHRIFTNDIGAMLRLYGVEAARSTIIRELSGVFESHSISVNPRHLTLVADWMTRAGGFAPFNRNGFSDKTSPFAKMSFETTFGFLRDAVCEGGSDDLTSPSARISVGKINRVGTGMFDVLTPVA